MHHCLFPSRGWLRKGMTFFTPLGREILVNYGHFYLCLLLTDFDSLWLDFPCRTAENILIEVCPDTKLLYPLSVASRRFCCSFIFQRCRHNESEMPEDYYFVFMLNLEDELGSIILVDCDSAKRLSGIFTSWDHKASFCKWRLRYATWISECVILMLLPWFLCNQLNHVLVHLTEPYQSNKLSSNKS